MKYVCVPGQNNNTFMKTKIKSISNNVYYYYTGVDKLFKLTHSIFGTLIHCLYLLCSRTHQIIMMYSRTHLIL